MKSSDSEFSTIDYTESSESNEHGQIDFSNGKEIPVKDRPRAIWEIVQLISPVLNKLHDKDYSNRYWLFLLQKHLTFCLRFKLTLESSADEEIRSYPYPILATKWPGIKYLIREFLQIFYRGIKYGSTIKDINNNITKADDFILGHRKQEMQKEIKGIDIGEIFIAKSIFLRKDKSKRKDLIILSKSQELNFIRKVLISLPWLYVENYELFEDNIELNNADRKTFHIEHLHSVSILFLLAKYADNGSKIINYQGGGHVGEVRNSPSLLAYIKYDVYKTYGWKIHEKDEPGMPFRLIDYSNKWKEKRSVIGKNFKGKVLFVLPQINERNKKFYSEFVNQFESRCRNFKNITVRTRPVSRKTSNTKVAKSMGLRSGIQIDPGNQELARIASEFELIIVCRLPATSFLECLYTNQPVMALDTNNNPSPLFESFKSDLQAFGIIHDNSESLIDKAASLNQTEDWWKEVSSNIRFQEFTRLFAGSK